MDRFPPGGSLLMKLSAHLLNTGILFHNLMAPESHVQSSISGRFRCGACPKRE